MTKVVKIGGVLLEEPHRAGAAIHAVAPDSSVVVVHGGGVQITRLLERMKIQSEFIDGLRVTDNAALGAVAMALLGQVHTSLVKELRSRQMPAVGLFGATEASRKPGPWGFVGTDLRTDPVVLTALLQAGRIPVIPTLALGTDSLLNVNGDETAASVAVALRCRELIFLTDVEGVKDGQGAVIDSAARPDELLSASFVTGGMIPKLRAVKTAMDGGVSVVRVGRTVFGGLS